MCECVCDEMGMMYRGSPALYTTFPTRCSLGVKYRKQEVAPRKDMLCGLLQLLFVYATCTVKGRVPRVSPGGVRGGISHV